MLHKIFHFSTRHTRNFLSKTKILAECKADFRVDKRDIALLIEALRVPLIFKCSNELSVMESKASVLF